MNHDNEKLSEKLPLYYNPISKESPIEYSFIDKIGFRNDDYRWNQIGSNDPTLAWIVETIKNNLCTMDFAFIPTSSLSTNSVENWSQDSIQYWNRLIDNNTFGLVIHSWNHSDESPLAKEMDYDQQSEYINQSREAFLKNLGWVPQGYIEGWYKHDSSTVQVLHNLGFSYICEYGMDNEKKAEIETINCEVKTEDWSTADIAIGLDDLKRKWENHFDNDEDGDIDYTGIEIHTMVWEKPEEQANLTEFIQWINKEYVNAWEAEWMTHWEYFEYITDYDEWNITQISEDEYIVDMQNMTYAHEVRWSKLGEWIVHDIADGNREKVDNLVIIEDGPIPFDSWEGKAGRLYSIIKA